MLNNKTIRIQWEKEIRKPKEERFLEVVMEN